MPICTQKLQKKTSLCEIDTALNYIENYWITRLLDYWELYFAWWSEVLGCKIIIIIYNCYNETFLCYIKTLDCDM